jgi:hypothetical protein
MTFAMVVTPQLAKLSPSARQEFVAKVLPRFVKYGLIFAGITLLFGIALSYFLFDALFNPVRAEGIYIGIGAALGLSAIFIGGFVVRPTVMKMSKLAMGAIENPGPPNPELGALQKRLSKAAPAVLVLLVLTLVFMVGAAWT